MKALVKPKCRGSRSKGRTMKKEKAGWGGGRRQNTVPSRQRLREALKPKESRGSGAQTHRHHFQTIISKQSHPQRKGKHFTQGEACREGRRICSTRGVASASPTQGTCPQRSLHCRHPRAGWCLELMQRHRSALPALVPDQFWLF